MAGGIDWSGTGTQSMDSSSERLEHIQPSGIPMGKVLVEEERWWIQMPHLTLPPIGIIMEIIMWIMKSLYRIVPSPFTKMRTPIEVITPIRVFRGEDLEIHPQGGTEIQTGDTLVREGIGGFTQYQWTHYGQQPAPHWQQWETLIWQQQGAQRYRTEKREEEGRLKRKRE